MEWRQGFAPFWLLQAVKRNRGERLGQGLKLLFSSVRELGREGVETHWEGEEEIAGAEGGLWVSAKVMVEATVVRGGGSGS